MAEYDARFDVTKRKRVIPVSRVVVHPSYSATGTHNDIALVHLQQEVEWSDFVQPACLPTPGPDTFTGMQATVAGWGNTQESGTRRLLPI